jgi:hypothetical protein
MLQEEHDVSEMFAFEMLVRRAADAGTSVRAAALDVIVRGHAESGN